MDHSYSNTEFTNHVHGKHIPLDERDQIQALHREGLSLRKIAERVGCAHTTVMYELRRGTPDKKLDVVVSLCIQQSEVIMHVFRIGLVVVNLSVSRIPK